MSLILNIETTTKICSVVLAEKTTILACKESETPQSHASLLTQFINDVLAQAGYSLKDIDAIAVSSGPGSYTGIRIGMATAKGLCYGLQCPLIKISTLQALANGLKKQLPHSLDHTYLVPMLDARRMEVFTAVFNKDLETIQAPHPKVVDAPVFREYAEKKLCYFGNGAKKCSAFFEKTKDVFVEDIQCSAKSMVELSNHHFQTQQFEHLSTTKADYFKSFYTKAKLL